jgi:N-acetylmuramoyl-L-alanine amidase
MVGRREAALNMIPDSIVIHHSLTADGTTVSWGAIRKYHMDPAGPYRMRDIGYHFGIELIGDRYEVLLGRLPNVEGAHCKESGMNHRSLGICLVGNYDLAEPPAEALEKLAGLVRWLVFNFKISSSRIFRHADFASKSCPGSLFPWVQFMEKIRSI